MRGQITGQETKHNLLPFHSDLFGVHVLGCSNSGDMAGHEPCETISRPSVRLLATLLALCMLAWLAPCYHFASSLSFIPQIEEDFFIMSLLQTVLDRSTSDSQRKSGKPVFARV
jgi:hypothetical protein